MELNWSEISKVEMNHGPCLHGRREDCVRNDERAIAGRHRGVSLSSLIVHLPLTIYQSDSAGVAGLGRINETEVRTEICVVNCA